MDKSRPDPLPAPGRRRHVARARARIALLMSLVVLMCFGAASIGQAAEVAPEAEAAIATDGSPASAAVLADEAMRFVQAGTVVKPPGVTRVAIEIGRLDPRLRLAPCALVRPYLPKGTRLWGRSNIGLRCERGPTAWNVYLPVTVRIFAQALSATSSLPAGVALTEEHFALTEVDLGAEPGHVFTRPPALVGRVLSRPLDLGQAIRNTQLKPRQWFAAGDTVRITAQGGGFAIRASGEALSPGVEGRSARVRTDSGRIITGLPVADRELELSL